jgi:hypothetical protein
MFRSRPLVVALLLFACDSPDDAPSSDASSELPLGPVATPQSSAGSPNLARPDVSGVVVHVASGSNVSASDAAAIGSVMRASLKRCASGDEKGKLTAQLVVDAEPSGKIRSVEATVLEELPASFKECLERSAKVAYFPETDGGAKVKLNVEIDAP